MGSLRCVFESFSKFNTREALDIFENILIVVSGNSLNRTSALGVDSGAIASSLSLREVSEFSFSGLQDQGIYYTTKTCLHFRRLFSIVLATGINTRIIRKYMMDASCPIMI